jgi:hypothetical protein
VREGAIVSQLSKQASLHDLFKIARRLYQPKTAFPLIFLRFIHRIRKSVKGKTRVR